MLGIKLAPYLVSFLFAATLFWFAAFPLGGLVYIELIKEKNRQAS
jgi:hypothetical protein